MVIIGNTSNSKTTESPDLMGGVDKLKSLMPSPPQYGAMNGGGDTCPTCRGTGRIPRG